MSSRLRIVASYWELSFCSKTKRSEVLLSTWGVREGMERCGVEREKGDEECGIVEYGEGEERSMGKEGGEGEERSMGKERWGGRGEKYGEGEVGRERWGGEM